MNTYHPTDDIVRLHTAPRMDPGLTVQLELFRAGEPQRRAPSATAPAQSLLTLPLPRPSGATSSSPMFLPAATGFGAPEQLRLFADDQPTDTHDALATRLATAPGLVRAGASRWDDVRTPIMPLSPESAYGDPELLRDLGARGAQFARELGVDVVVGAETAGVPLAAAVSLAGGVPFAFVRKPGYRGHEPDEPPVRGAQVAGRRVLLVDDAVSRTPTSTSSASTPSSTTGPRTTRAGICCPWRHDQRAVASPPRCSYRRAACVTSPAACE